MARGGSAHSVRDLFRQLTDIAAYPPGVVPVPEQIAGTSFFPGGTGLWCDEAGRLPDLPVGKIMILGHVFHSVAGYEWARRNKQENLKSPTWRHLLPFLDDASIARGDCFFTNYFMGLREGPATTGPFPGAKDPMFVERCGRFFLRQLELLRPRLLLVLGAHVPSFLSSQSPELKRWGHLKSFVERDNDDAAVIRGATFGADGLATTVVSLVHPSFRPRNVGIRRWRGKFGAEAELGMTLYALESDPAMLRALRG